MKRFALSTMLLALLGLTVGCGGAATDEAAPEVEAPPVGVEETEVVETEEEAPAE
ncbi:hypothetical protein KOR34_35900 [Posidoniimonas corsicana]|uniref:Uncharacterized protein n=1 Tax=Posidoniimonas corsicana TaxID=1938618 RepID=A0A5C5V7G1_9BACT|nr:hypothetical protein [Posidoniimonas corsicana]TWT33757.1 hypothetical protein KOR34_35900 [Posidoniimonas corsicana]